MAYYKSIHSFLKKVSTNLSSITQKEAARTSLMQKYGVLVGESATPDQISAVRESLSSIPHKLALDCGIHSLDFDDLGPSMRYYPNHGKYSGGTLILNSRILDDPKVESDDLGNSINKFNLILYHELGHGFDEKNAKGEMLCLEPNWLNLSGWSEKPNRNLRRMIIRQRGKPELADLWFYDPMSGFPRYYGKRNPWDDWADCFAFYVGGVKGRLPDNKLKYFDSILGGYYG